MKKLAAAAVLALALAGSAGADTFRVVPNTPATLPSAQVPNLPGSIVLPPALSSPPVRPQQISYAEPAPRHTAWSCG